MKDEVASTRDDIESGNLDIWAESAFSDRSEGERYMLMGAGGNGSYADGLEGSFSEQDLPGE